MSNPVHPESHQLARWRLVLGKDAEAHNIGCEEDAACQRIESLVGFLFDDSASGGGGSQGGERSGGGPAGHPLTVPEWVEAVNELFPHQAKEVMQRELIRRRGIDQLLESPELLEKVEPNVDLAKTIMTHRDLLTPKTRVLARKLIERVVQQLKERMQIQVEQAITGAIRRDKHSPRAVYRNLDLSTTIRRNLKNYDRDLQRLLVDRLYFYAAERKKRPWHIIVAVDQSGSMLDSAIFSTIMASIFYELPSVRTSLFLFDTEIADLSEMVGQPVDILLSVQLGGGTNIAKAVTYAEQITREPARTIVVLITDFYEGGSESDLVNKIGEMAQAGIRLIGLGALGYDARPDYNKATAKKCRKAGMDILVCTPEKLAECMAQIILG
ncbi:VWA domain containing CoxE-like protein [Symmachiella dynata]|uniref:VWA domain-containing protein n=1 Tax=Symmachiella dynata TaxID=2527995 RepID=UPI0011878DDB|nr:VWA domain-containing protein [Symmachiella dynata]QDT48953.1 VWA domain containing CoxE-like protein [Symmachiella dynata]